MAKKAKELTPAPKPTPKPIRTRLTPPGPSWQGASHTFIQVFSQVKQNLSPAVFIAALYTLGVVIDSLTSKAPPVTAATEQLPGVALLATSSNFQFLFTAILIVAVPLYALAVADGKEVTAGTIFRASPLTYVYAILATMLTTAAYLIGSLAILIPLIWLVPWLSMVLYEVVENGHSPFEAIKQSYRLTKEHLWKVWGIVVFELVLAVPILVAILSSPRPVGLVLMFALNFAGVLYYCALAILYRWLQKQPQD